MIAKPMPKAKFADSRCVETALIRVEHAAREEALQSNISIAIQQSGKFVKILVH